MLLFYLYRLFLLSCGHTRSRNGSLCLCRALGAFIPLTVAANWPTSCLSMPVMTISNALIDRYLDAFGIGSLRRVRKA